MAAERSTVDLSGYPDLVVIYLGLKVQSLRGLRAMLGVGPEIQAAVKAKPEGLLLHEPMLLSVYPLHVGMRQYWSNFDALEAWTRTLPHSKWWSDFHRDPGGVMLWHETYMMRGGMEGVYVNAARPIGLGAFAPNRQPIGEFVNSRKRLDICPRDSAETTSGRCPVPHD